ncbi:MAG: DUF424 family protein [Nitrososphaerota archaeon]|nr:DUF424 family protein [Aigarchaeota archaeon]MDW8076412.1 DUF424 family protein [Nitrososphaerota archaeon]
MSEWGRFWVKLHHSRTGEVVAAICDEELLGKRIVTEKGFEIKVDNSFYGGVLVEGENVIRYIEQATIINLLGNRIVGMLISKGFIHERAAIKVGGIMHVQMFY